jgi:O-succinylbenzoic acid--CoA ligase
MASQVATSTNNELMNILPYRQVKIVNNEILLKGATCFIGYFNVSKRKGEWFASKDLGQLKNNILSIIGRQDRLFISGGENIQPEEIEKVLLTFEEIKKAVIVAVDDDKYGQRPVAFLDCEISPSLKMKISSALSYFKIPVRYLILPSQIGLKISLKTLQNLANEDQ